MPRRARIAEASAVGIFTLFVAWPFLRPGRSVVGYDTVAYAGPNLAFTFSGWKAGHLPMWNDALFGGVYHLANPQAAVLYPVKLLFLPLRAGQALDLITATHLLLLAFGTWWLLARRLATRPPSAAIGAIVVVGGGVLMARALQFEQIAVIAWVPWTLGGLDRCLEPTGVLARPGRKRAVVAAGAALAMLLVAGHPQQVFIAAPLLGAWVVVRALDRRDPAAPLRSLAVPVGSVVGAGALALSLAAVQLVPAALALPESAKVDAPSLRASSERSYAVEPGYLPATLLGPGFRARPLATSASFEALGYVGAAAGTLAAFGIIAGLRDRHRRGTTVGLLVLGTTTLLFAIGPRCAGPPDAFACSGGGLAYRAGFHLVPGFGLARVPGRWLLVTTFALAILAAFGADALCRRALERRDVLVGGALVTVAGLAAVLSPTALPGGLPSSTPIVWAVTAAVALGAAVVGARSETARTPVVVALTVLVALELAWPQPHSPARENLSPVAFDELGGTTAAFVGEARVLSLAGQPFDDLAYLSRALKPNTNVTAGVASVDGYDGGVQVTSPWVAAMDALTAGPFDPELPLGWQIDYPPDPGLLARHGVRYVLFDPTSTARGLGEPEPDSDATRRRVRDTFLAGWGEPVHTEGTIETFENPAYRADALVYHRVRDQALVDPGDADPDETLVASGTATPRECAAPCPPTPAVLRRPRPGALDVSVDTPDAGLLVVPETHLPGWSATVDDTPATVFTADGRSVGVDVPAGRHEVRLRYRAPGLRAGAVLSTAGALAAVVLLATSLGWRPRVGALRPR